MAAAAAYGAALRQVLQLVAEQARPPRAAPRELAERAAGALAADAGARVLATVTALARQHVRRRARRGQEKKRKDKKGKGKERKE